MSQAGLHQLGMTEVLRKMNVAIRARKACFCQRYHRLTQSDGSDAYGDGHALCDAARSEESVHLPTRFSHAT